MYKYIYSKEPEDREFRIARSTDRIGQKAERWDTILTQ